jgi:hypothetical protein
MGRPLQGRLKVGAEFSKSQVLVVVLVNAGRGFALLFALPVVIVDPGQY